MESNGFLESHGVFRKHIVHGGIASLLQEGLPSGIIRSHDSEHTLTIDNGFEARQFNGLEKRGMVSLALHHLPSIALEPVWRLVVVIVGNVLTRHDHNACNNHAKRCH